MWLHQELKYSIKKTKKYTITKEYTINIYIDY